MSVRKIKRVHGSVPTVEGAGVHLFRAFGFLETGLTDPFLLLDDFHGDDYGRYMAGFPWHPHRGIETVTYMVNGEVEHGDSLGNTGVIGSGDVQWMTAGGGIIHQEMPLKVEGFMQGFQLWVNLPGSRKMMAPRYRGIVSGDIPDVVVGGARVKVIAGEFDGVRGPVEDLVVAVEYLDVNVHAGDRFTHGTAPGDTVFAYVFQGEAVVDGTRMGSGSLIVFEEGGGVEFNAGPEGGRFLLVSGELLGEPVAWRGPIVMNTQDELDLAFRELREGTFIKE
jgi:hypothetical protein